MCLSPSAFGCSMRETFKGHSQEGAETLSIMLAITLPLMIPAVLAKIHLMTATPCAELADSKEP